MSRKDEPLGNVFLPLDREAREWLADRARVEHRNPLELAAELLKQKLAELPSATLN